MPSQHQWYYHSDGAADASCVEYAPCMEIESDGDQALVALDTLHTILLYVTNKS